MISASKIKQEYKKLWKGFLIIPPTCKSPQYALVDSDEILALIHQCTRHKQQFKDNTDKCEIVSLLLWAEVVEKWEQENSTPLPIGRASGLRFKGDLENHTLVTYYSRQGIYLYDRFRGGAWKANPDNDIVFLVEM